MDPFLSLCNRLYEVTISNTNCIGNWGFYLLDKEFDDEPELRIRIGTIWLCSLLDTLEAQHAQLPKLVKEAEENEWPTLVHAAGQLEKFCGVVAQVLGLFSRDEQIFLSNWRNQLVHSYLAGRHRDRIGVKFASEGRVISITLPWREYHDIFNSFTADKGHDTFQAASPLLARALDQKLVYWSAVHLLRERQERMYEVMRLGGTINILA